MKNLVVLNALNNSKYCTQKVFNSLSCNELALQWALTLDFCQKVLVLISSEEQKSDFPQVENVEFVVKNADFSVCEFFNVIVQESSGFENIVYAFADCPFLNVDLAKKIYSLHDESRAEYSFSDGYSYGVGCEIINCGTLNILAKLSESEKWQNQKVCRTTIFDLLKTDINSFEIETYIADSDYRDARLEFSCDTKNNFLFCQKVFSSWKNENSVLPNNACGEEFSKFSQSKAEFLCGVPSYYAIQICQKNYGKFSFCPIEMTDEKFMAFSDFEKLIDKIAEFSENAVISLSHFCDATLHPEFEKFIEKVLEKSGLSVLIELSGTELPLEKIENIAKICQKAEKRTSVYEKIYWIVSLDSTDEKMYDKIHFAQNPCSKNTFATAVKNIENLKKYFPFSVYPQFCRMGENEEQLESFFRFWKENNDERLIIKKYDWFCGKFEQKKTCDLSPIERNVCWHLRRDFVIFADGKVPLCPEIFPGAEKAENNEEFILGNAFTDDLGEIYGKRRVIIENQFCKKYDSICGKCDEYYIFNF